MKHISIGFSIHRPEMVPAMQYGGKIIAQIILDVLHGETLENAIAAHGRYKGGNVSATSLESLIEFSDHIVVGKHFSSAC